MHVGNWLIVGQRSDHTGRVGDVSGVKRLLLYCIILWYLLGIDTKYTYNHTHTCIMWFTQQLNC